MTTQFRRSDDQSAPLLSVRSLSVSFQTAEGAVNAVQDVSLDIHRGQTLAIVGESGSGKSTTASAINRLLPENGNITSGQILFADMDIAQATEAQMRKLRGAGIGWVPQDPMSNLNPMMKIGDQVIEALAAHDRIKGKDARREAVKLLEMVGIPEPERRLSQHPHEFSGGMRQRALIAIGLACRPRLLIADEPTSALDVTVQRRILDQLEGLTTQFGTAVCLITHDLGLAAERADHIAVMRNGEIVEQNDVNAIMHDPQHAYTKKLLTAAPSLSTRSIAAPIDISQRAREKSHDDTDGGSQHIISTTDLVKDFELKRSFGTQERYFRAVNGTSFSIPYGQTVSIVGESGSGKSTIANMILGLEPITSGKIDVDGQDMTGFSKDDFFAFRRRVQPVFQNPYASLDPRYSVERSIAEPLRVHRVDSRHDRRKRVAQLLDQVALPNSVAPRLPHELSGGQQQRVAIARALALAPDLVVLDEAVSALDVLVQNQILELLAELQHELGLSYLFISHDLAVVRMISHQVHVMKSGEFVESGTPDEIFARPQSEYTRELLAAIPTFKAAS